MCSIVCNVHKGWVCIMPTLPTNWCCTNKAKYKTFKWKFQPLSTYIGCMQHHLTRNCQLQGNFPALKFPCVWGWREISLQGNFPALEIPCTEISLHIGGGGGRGKFPSYSPHHHSRLCQMDTHSRNSSAQWLIIT